MRRSSAVLLLTLELLVGSVVPFEDLNYALESIKKMSQLLYVAGGIVVPCQETDLVLDFVHVPISRSSMRFIYPVVGGQDPLTRYR